MGKIRDANQLENIKDRIATTISTINSDMNVQQGHVIKDVVVDAPSEEFRYAYVLLDYVNTIKSLNGIANLLSNTTFKTDIMNALELDSLTDVEDLISADLDDLASVFGVTRRAAISAKYMQRFYRSDDNSGSPITIPVGTTVKTADGSTSAAVTASVPQVPVLDTDNGLYYAEETVTATVDGTDGNVVLGSLKILSPQIGQATSTSNVSLLTSGVDEETDAALISRIENVRKGRNLQTKAGLENVALGTAEDSTLNFTDALVVDPSSALMTRAYAGSVDIYVVGKDVQTIEERINHIAAGTTYTLSNQPVESVISVAGSTSGPLAYVFIQDVISAVYGSTRANSTLTVPGGLAGEVLTVSYRIDQAIVDAQRLVDSDEDFIVSGADILFRQGDQTTINIEIQVFYFGTRSQSLVKADIESDLAVFFAGGTTSNGERLTAKILGENIDRSDVLSIVTDIDDVDRVTLIGANAIKFYKDGVLNSDDPIVVADNEYARAGTVTFL